MSWRSCGARRVGKSSPASVPAAARTEKYTARARAVLALARSTFQGSRRHRLEGFQALVGVPVPDATQWDQGELVGDCWRFPFL